MACRNLAISNENTSGYFPHPSHYDEMVALDKNRSHYQAVGAWLEQTSLSSMLESRKKADTIFRQEGITFTV